MGDWYYSVIEAAMMQSNIGCAYMYISEGFTCTVHS